MAKNTRALAADAMTKRLSDALGEPTASRGLHYYAWTLGSAVCEELLQEALALAEVEEAEARRTADGKRRRTTGGIFFTLAKRREESR